MSFPFRRSVGNEDAPRRVSILHRVCGWSRRIQHAAGRGSTDETPPYPKGRKENTRRAIATGIEVEQVWINSADNSTFRSDSDRTRQGVVQDIITLTSVFVVCEKR